MDRYRVGRKMGLVILDTNNSLEVARATTGELAQEICRLLNQEFKKLNITDVVGQIEQFSLADMKEAYNAGENNAGSYTYPPFEEWFSKR